VDNSFRLFNCALCHTQTKLCRPCDRGNIYCSKGCAKKRRNHSLRDAGKKYQQTFKGRRKHADRQKRHRHQKKQKVTHQGTQDSPAHGFLETATKQEVIQETYLQPQLGIDEVHQQVLLQVKPEAPDLVRCDMCGNWCGPFARQKFWHGGRNYQKLRRKYRDNKRNRGRDSAPTPRGRLAAKHNWQTITGSLFNSKESAYS
jgi:hypothetical protein